MSVREGKVSSCSAEPSKVTRRGRRALQLLIVGNSHVNCYGGHLGRSPEDYEMNPIDEGRGFMRIGGDPGIRVTGTRPSSWPRLSA